MQTRILAPDASGIIDAARFIAEGQLVAIPTETVYGLAGDARSAVAVARIFEAKGRPSFNPLIVHVPDSAAAQSYGVWSDMAECLANAFWPGPLTLVLPLRPTSGLPALVTAGQTSVALRVPAHPLAQALLRASGAPLAAPSANLSGRISPTRHQHVIDGLGGRIAAVLNGGPCEVGVESTIIGLVDMPILLRPGGQPIEAIEAALGAPIARRGEDGAVTAPGQMASHYAPTATMRLNASTVRAGEVMLGFGGTPDAALDLSLSGDLVEAAAALFDHLHKLDAAGVGAIAVAPVPSYGLGRAINDRLRRAAAPKGA
jgi:L-threonylcarbamoyladenylate synthase